MTTLYHVLRRARLFAAGALLFLTIHRAPALLIDDYSPAANDLYSSGFTGQDKAPDPVLNTDPSFIGAGLDWSGVGWVSGGISEGTQAVTLIDPQHFLFATHYAPSNGSTVSFTNQQGHVKTYSIQSLQNTTFNGSVADVSVGTLTAPIPGADLVAFYPILSMANESAYLNLPLLVFGKTAFVGRNTIAGFVDSNGSGNPAGRDFYMVSTDGLYTAQTESGDSGSPSFVVVNGKLAIVGLDDAILNGNTTFNGTNKTFDQFVPYYISQLNTIVSAKGYSVTTVQLPGSGVTPVQTAGSGDIILPGVALSVAGVPAIDAAGDVAFHAFFKGVGASSGVTSLNNAGILLYTGSTPSLIARAGGTDTVTGATFTQLGNPVLSASGALAFIGALKPHTGDAVATNASGVWVDKQGVMKLVARTSGATPGLAAVFTAFSQLAVNSAGGVTLLATVSGKGIAGRGLFATDQSGNLQLLARAGGSLAVDGTLSKVLSLSPFVPPPSVAGQSRTLGGGGDVAFRLQPGKPAAALELALTGPSGFNEEETYAVNDLAPGLGGTIRTLGIPAVNASGQVAFAFTTAGPGLTVANNAGIALASSTGSTLVARTGAFAPDTGGGVTSAVFARLSDPVLNDNGRIAFIGTLKAFAGGVTAANDLGIWSDADGTLKQIARKNDLPLGGGGFSVFNQLVLPDVGGAIFLATLSGVSAAQNQGVWAIGGDGTLAQVLRKGDTLDFHGAPKTVKAIGIFQQAPGDLSQTRSFDPGTGKLVAEVTFTDGTWGIYTVNIP